MCLGQLARRAVDRQHVLRTRRANRNKPSPFSLFSSDVGPNIVFRLHAILCAIASEMLRLERFDRNLNHGIPKGFCL